MAAITQNSRSSHFPDFNHLVIKAFAKHLASLNDVYEASRYGSTNLKYFGYSGVIQQRDLPEVEH
jgi:hypothetical protein